MPEKPPKPTPPQESAPSENQSEKKEVLSPEMEVLKDELVHLQLHARYIDPESRAGLKPQLDDIEARIQTQKEKEDEARRSAETAKEYKTKLKNLIVDYNQFQSGNGFAYDPSKIKFSHSYTPAEKPKPSAPDMPASPDKAETAKGTSRTYTAEEVKAIIDSLAPAASQARPKEDAPKAAAQTEEPKKPKVEAASQPVQAAVEAAPQPAKAELPNMKGPPQTPEVKKPEALEPIFGLNPSLVKLMQPKESKQWIRSARGLAESAMANATPEQREAVKQIQENPKKRGKVKGWLIAALAVFGVGLTAGGVAVGVHEANKYLNHHTPHSESLHKATGGKEKGNIKAALAQKLNDKGNILGSQHSGDKYKIAPQIDGSKSAPYLGHVEQQKAAKPDAAKAGASSWLNPNSPPPHITIHKSSFEQIKKASHENVRHSLANAVAEKHASQEDADLVTHWEGKFGGLPEFADQHILEVIKIIKVNPDNANAFAGISFESKTNVAAHEVAPQVASTATEQAHEAEYHTPHKLPDLRAPQPTPQSQSASERPTASTTHSNGTDDGISLLTPENASK